jgi:hypothetical protein
MKRALSTLGALTLIIFMTPSAQALSTTTVTEPTHQQINGLFVDDELAKSIAGTGRLGQLIFNPSSKSRTWVIDPALVEEIEAMAKGYKLISGAPGTGQLFAETWLSQLKIATKNEVVTPMAYGDPSLYWVNQLSPHEGNYILSLSQTKLALQLNRTDLSAPRYQSNSKFSLTSSDISAIKSDYANFSETAPFINPSDIDTYRLGLIKILNPNLTKDRREYLIRDLTASAYAQMHLVHLSTGKFTVTSSHQGLPITLTNGFPTDIKVNLKISATNPRVQVTPVTVEKIPANSKIQVMVPITVLTSGASGLNVEVTTSSGQLLGDPVLYPLNLAVISPVATWFTTGAAILLFFAATIQSIRRMRRRKK